MEIPLAEDLIKGLAVLRDPAKIPNDVFGDLIRITVDIVANVQTEESISNSKVLAAADKILLKQVYSSIVALILEAGKINTDPSDLRTYLVNQKFSEERADFIAKKYGERFTDIRRILSFSTFNFPHVVNVDWRMDYLIKGENLEKLNRPTYYIKLKTMEKDNKEGQVEFVCTQEQLTDLVNKLKDAEYSLERLDVS